MLREPDGPRRIGVRARAARARATRSRVRGPRNHFPLVPAPRYLFVAGGIGITPILPMIAAAEAAGAEWTAAVRRAHAARRWRSARSWRSATATGSRSHPQDEIGLLDLDRLLGAPGRARSSTAAARSRCSTPSSSGARLAGRRAARRAVRAEGRGATGADRARSRWSWRASGRHPHRARRSRLDPARSCEEAGVAVLSSCREGTCGTCETAVLAGRARPPRLACSPTRSRPPNDTMMICVSRCRAHRAWCSTCDTWFRRERRYGINFAGVDPITSFSTTHRGLALTRWARLQRSSGSGVSRTGRRRGTSGRCPPGR